MQRAQYEFRKMLPMLLNERRLVPQRLLNERQRMLHRRRRLLLLLKQRGKPQK
jgi:hypothetical protein